jgi:uncharacterized protein involved in oxidation of intracellular sulfur
MAMKRGLVIYSNDPETVWNAFRFGVHSLKQGDQVGAFLLGRGVEAEGLADGRFPVAEVLRDFAAAGGSVLACGTCLKLRQQAGSDLCPLSSLADVHALVRDGDRVLTF